MTNDEIVSLFAAELDLRRPPVALAFLEAPPPGVPANPAPVPSACAFWRRAEAGVFFAPAEAHYECPVGTMTMGFPLPADQMPRAEALVNTMVGLEYLRAEEAARMPAVAKSHKGVLYGPLAGFPVDPDVVLLFLTPRQAMLVAESAGSLALRDTPGLAAMGRPACVAVARAANSGAPHLSLGCIGARTYLELEEDLELIALPRAALADTASRLATLARANRELAAFHRAQKARFT
jgi:uncharacterized protein (DUF169 family)